MASPRGMFSLRPNCRRALTRRNADACKCTSGTGTENENERDRVRERERGGRGRGGGRENLRKWQCTIRLFEQLRGLVSKLPAAPLKSLNDPFV